MNNNYCKTCGEDLDKDDLFCPKCGNRIYNSKLEKLKLQGFTILYIIIMISAVGFGIIGYNIYDNYPALANALYSLAIAFGPVSILGLIYENILKDSLVQAGMLTFSSQSENVCSKSINELNERIQSVEDYSYRLMNISKVGLIAAFSVRAKAFKYIEEAISVEENEIFIVGTSFRGLLWPYPGEEKIMNLLREKIKNRQCKVRFLLTHPAFAHLRQKLESFQRIDSFHIAQEILETVKILRDAGVKSEDIKFVLATPTVFGIKTSKYMLLNPYPYQRQAFTSITFVLKSKIEKDEVNPVYEAFDESHFRGVWQSNNVQNLHGFSKSDIQDVFEKTLDTLNLVSSNKKLDFNGFL